MNPYVYYLVHNLAHDTSFRNIDTPEEIRGVEVVRADRLCCGANKIYIYPFSDELGFYVTKTVGKWFSKSDYVVDRFYPRLPGTDKRINSARIIYKNRSIHVLSSNAISFYLLKQNEIALTPEEESKSIRKFAANIHEYWHSKNYINGCLQNLNQGIEDQNQLQAVFNLISEEMGMTRLSFGRLLARAHVLDRNANMARCIPNLQRTIETEKNRIVAYWNSFIEMDSKNYERQISLIRNLPQVNKLFVHPKYLTVITNDITIRRRSRTYEMGQFVLLLSTTGRTRIYPFHNNQAANGNVRTSYHPYMPLEESYHIFCTGNERGNIENAVKEYNFHRAFIYLMRLLQDYDSNNPYCSIGNFQPKGTRRTSSTATYTTSTSDTSHVII